VLIVLAVPASLVLRRTLDGTGAVNPLHSGPAPAFTLSGLDGETVSLAALRGRPVVVNFWGSWCLQCRDELPLLAEAARRHPKVAFVGVVFRDKPEDARRTAGKAGAAFPILLDPQETAARAYGVQSAPVTFFITPDGTIAGDLIGPVTLPLVEKLVKRASG
jgi:cytochrome c biogenesis protein CcmG/thiol:disulfide interchange protein DsbE